MPESAGDGRSLDHRAVRFEYTPGGRTPSSALFDVACACGYKTRLSYHKRYKVTEPGEVGQGGTLSAPHYPWLAAMVVLEATFDMSPAEALASIQALQDSGAGWDWAWAYLQSQRPMAPGAEV